MSEITRLPDAPLPQAPRLSAAGPSAEKTAQEFEATFIEQMTKLMLESVPTDDQFSGGHGEEMFRGVLAEKLGGEIAKRGGIGLAPIVLDQIIKLQGGAADVR